MISQDSQTATLTVEVSQKQSTEGMLLGAIARSALEEAILRQVSHPREQRNGLYLLSYEGRVLEKIIK